MNIDATEVAAILQRAITKGRRIDGLWSLSSIAAWCEISERKARDLVNTPGFPKGKRLPPNGHPRWVAAEVIRWWDEYRQR